MIVFVCSPYRGNVNTNVEIAKCICRDLVFKGHTPIAPHLIYPQFLRDGYEKERNMGMTCSFEILEVCESVMFYKYHISAGMRAEMEQAWELEKPVYSWDGAAMEGPWKKEDLEWDEKK